MNLRNIAIIAHVDHGKTALVDGILKYVGTFRENQDTSNFSMDSNDIEKERGITILAKTTSIVWNNTSISRQCFIINIIYCCNKRRTKIC